VTTEWKIHWHDAVEKLNVAACNRAGSSDDAPNLPCWL
jgi:hypothetical protein